MAAQPDAGAGAAAHTSTAEQTSPDAVNNKPVEPSDSPVSPVTANEQSEGAVQEQDRDTSTEAVSPMAATPVTATQPPTNDATPSHPEPTEQAPSPLTRKESEALGPALDAPIALLPATAAAGPTLSISLMLTTGARHLYKIDEKYLRSRKVEARSSDGSFNPKEVGGYQLKELIWIDWRSEWEPRPSSPSAIRLIIMGRMIEDKASLKDFPFNMETINVVHMTVKPADLMDDDDPAGKGTGKGGVLRARDAQEQGAGCRCVIL